MASKDYNIAKKTIQDEILANLAKIADRHGSVFNVTSRETTAGNTTLVSVSGKGRFYGAAFCSLNSAKQANSISITIDGVTTTISATAQNDGTGVNVVYVGNTEDITMTGNGMLVFFNKVTAGSTNYTVYDFDYIVPFENTSVTSESASSTSIKAGCFFDKYMEFEESLVVTISQTSSTAECAVKYTLE